MALEIDLEGLSLNHIFDFLIHLLCILLEPKSLHFDGIKVSLDLPQNILPFYHKVSEFRTLLFAIVILNG